MSAVRPSARPAYGSARDAGLPQQLAAAIRWIYAPVLAHRRAFLVLNLVYFGAALAGAAYAAADPSRQQALLAAAGEAFSPTGTFGRVGQAYLDGQLLPAVGLTFGVNLVIGSFLYITVPSLFLGLGLVAGVLRGFLWGLLFAPFGGLLDATMLPHALTILVEGEAYVIAMLGVWLWWRPVFGASGQRLRLWMLGMKLQGRIYVAVACMLAVAAVYEVLEVVYLIPRL
jgi:hypothetical protein